MDPMAAWLILVTTATTSSGVLFSSWCTSKHRERIFWPILAHFDQFCLCCRKFTHFLVYFLQANNVAVYKYEVCMADGWFKLITWKNGMQGLMRRIRPPINRQDAYNGEPRTRKHVRNISSSMPWRSTWDIGRPSAINCFVWGNWPSLT